MRIFIAFDIPESIKDRIVVLQKEIAKLTKKIRFVNRDNMHITLKFLGEQPYQAINRISDILDNIGFGAKTFKVSLNSYGVFRNLENPNVIWVGEFNNREFEKISNMINTQLELFRKADNKPLCHLTIGRMKNIPKREIIDALKVCSEFVKDNDLSFYVNEFYLYESKLHRSGAIYKKMKKFGLKENNDG